MPPSPPSQPVVEPSGVPRETESTTSPEPATSPRLNRNILVLAGYHVALRLAWIFKTESVIIPAFLDAIVGTSSWRATLRGCLPILNRLGHSVPPLMYADRLTAARYKKSSLVGSTLLMAAPFLALSASWFLRLHERISWFPFVFLGLYALFFAATGLNQLGFGTLQGKIIPPDRRGRLMAIAGVVGSILSVLAAWFVMPAVLQVNSEGRMQGFGTIFAVSGFGFVVAALMLLPVEEPPDGTSPPHQRGNRFGRAWSLFREDARFRRLAIVAMLYMTTQLIFPHYQALGLRDSPGDVRGFRLMLWVVVQNLGVGVFSTYVGSVADRAGNRLAVRLVVFAAATTPLVAIVLTAGWVPGGTDAYWIVFLLLSLSPVGMRLFSNYVLEFGEPRNHPHYLSTFKLCMAVPFLFSPLVGFLIGWVGFAPVFIAISVCILVAGALTFTLHEPRHA